MLDLALQISAAADYIRSRWKRKPQVGIVLGTGLGDFAAEVEAEVVIPYGDIPHFPAPTALGHKGRLVCGTCRGVPVVTMDGRYHCYEGYSLKQITLPVRVLKELGIELLVLSNASGGMNPRFQVGDVMIIVDHINLMGDNPLIGPNDDALGPRFPHMCDVYDSSLVDRAMEIARQADFTAHRGVYVGLKGPNFETRAEYRFLRTIGADAVGMSTVPEVIVAAHMRLPVLAISAVTNVCDPDALEKATGEDVIDAAKIAEPKMRRIVLEILAERASR
ncbi:MAG: purine-nucleoside phosphorylase [Planctomycetia bacterium]|nr:purine-nucleoside phosphorylase [Planctomycetia bacterium]